MRIEVFFDDSEIESVYWIDLGVRVIYYWIECSRWSAYLFCFVSECWSGWSFYYELGGVFLMFE